MSIEENAVASQNEDRRCNVASALASFGMEGLEPDLETAVILEHYASGRMTLEEMGAAIEAHVKNTKRFIMTA